MHVTNSQILLLLEKQRLKPSVLANKLGISRQALHAHLRALIKERRILRHGTPPHVQYSVASKGTSSSRVVENFTLCREQLLPQYLRKFSKHLEHYLGQQKKMKGTQYTPDLVFLLDAAAVYSSNIEGNTLDLNSFLNSRMSPRKHRPKEAQEIEDLVSAYAFACKNDLKEQYMLQTHKILSRQFVATSRQGRYRKEPVGVFSRHGLVYMAVEPNLVEDEMHALCMIVTDLLKKKHTVAERFFWGSWLHLMIALIHPFSDGNGRMARLCEKWFLASTLGERCFALPTEESYWNNRSKYYDVLKLGANYWETDMGKSLAFLSLLTRALLNEEKMQ